MVPERGCEVGKQKERKKREISTLVDPATAGSTDGPIEPWKHLKLRNKLWGGRLSAMDFGWGKPNSPRENWNKFEFPSKWNEPMFRVTHRTSDKSSKTRLRTNRYAKVTDVSMIHVHIL